MDMKILKMTILLALFMAVPMFSLNAVASENNGAWLGIYTQSIDQNLKEAFNLDTDHGVVVKMLIPDSPADEAGLKQGDIILTFGGKDLDGADQLIEDMKAYKPGDKVVMNVIRKGNEKEIAVTLGSRTDQEKADDNVMKWYGSVPHNYSKSYKFFNSQMADTYIGVSLQSLSEQLGDYFGVADGNGALIEEVMPESPAEKAGLKAGDVIVKIDGNNIEGPSDVQNDIWDKEKGDKVEVTVVRDKKEQTFALEVEESPEGHSLGRLDGIPGFDNTFFMPRMKGLFNGNMDKDNFFDSEDFQQQMDQLQEQMQQLREQMMELKEKVD